MVNNPKNNTLISHKDSRQKSLLITSIVAITVLLVVILFKWTEVRETQQTRIVVNFVEEPPFEIPEEMQKLQPEVNHAISSESSSSSEASSSNQNTQANGKQNTSTSPKSPIRSNEVSKDGQHVSASQNNAKGKGKKDEEKGEADHLINQLKKRNTSGGNGTKEDNKRGTGNREGAGEGNGTGDGKIGEGGRILLEKIPGTMGAGGKIPEHSCETIGRVYFKYYVDKNGNVTKVEFVKGKSDPCLVATGQKWIKQYVKASKGSGTSYGTYDISF